VVDGEPDFIGDAVALQELVMAPRVLLRVAGFQIGRSLLAPADGFLQVLLGAVHGRQHRPWVDPMHLAIRGADACLRYGDDVTRIVAHAVIITPPGRLHVQNGWERFARVRSYPR